MSRLAAIPVLCLLGFSLTAAEVREPNPFVVSLQLETPFQSELQGYGASTAAVSPGIAYVFCSRRETFWSENGHGTWAAKLEADCFPSTSAHSGATGVGLGVEHTHYWHPGFKGLYTSVELLAYQWSFTQLNGAGSARETPVTLAAGVAVGYRFDPVWSVEATIKSPGSYVTPAPSTFGIGVKAHF